MLKVVAVVDKKGTAIDRLAQALKPYFTNLDYKVLDYHPKRPDRAQVEAFEREAMDADLISFDYFRTAEKIKELHPWVKDKKKILNHYNPYSIYEKDWNDYDYVIGCNKYIYEELGTITTAPVEYIPLCVDTDFWAYNPDWKADQSNIRSVIMVANRIEGKKGVLPVALACKKLGLTLQLVGAISDADYFSKVIETGVVKFHEQISDEALRELYYKSTVHICNSVDNYESGTMPVLEAMLCGVPVISRKVGHVNDLYNGENMLINENDPENVDALVDLLHELVSDKKRMDEIRDKAWNTAKTRSTERRAFMLQKLYRQVLFPDSVPVSVVMPIYDKPDVIRKCLNAFAQQTYKNIELIVPDDSLTDENEKLVYEVAQYMNLPVRYIKTAQVMVDAHHEQGYKDYGLARARNISTIEATGDVMVYCDQRQVPESNAIEEFMKYVKPRHWVFGDKGSNKDSFVENFSCVYRSDIIRFGLFSERGTEYGFQSQYCRAVAREQALKTEFCRSAKAVPSGKSSNRNRKRQEIVHSKNKLFKMDLE